MKTRVLTAVVMVAVMIPFFVFSETVAFPILTGFLGLVGAYEMQGCLGKRRFWAASVPPILVCAGMPFLVRYGAAESQFGFVFLISFSLVVYLFIVSVFSGKKLPVTEAALSGATGVYVAFGFASLVLLRDLPHGLWIVLLAFLIPWMTDTFAYFSGRLFGKHKLIPEVSPKKTVEGSVGGTLCAVLLTLLYAFLVGLLTDASPRYLPLAVVALVVSLLSQCGDLIMSLIKRHYGIKDYGTLFPGHGGVLDRFDSIVCTAPFLYFLSATVPGFALFL